VKCGKSIAFDANVCPYCGHDYRAVMAGPAAAPHEKGMLSIVGGILILISGIVGLAIGGIFLAVNLSTLSDYGIPGDLTDQLESLLRVCGAIFLILGIIAVLGGFFGVMRKHFGLVILGGITGLLACAPFAFAGYLVVLPILPLVGLILVGVAKKDFD
jgi:hypothetical protein